MMGSLVLPSLPSLLSGYVDLTVPSPYLSIEQAGLSVQWLIFLLQIKNVRR